MTILSVCLIGLISIIVIIYLLAQYVFNERQIYRLKYILYVSVIMTWSTLIIPIFLIRPRNVLNMCIAASTMSPVLNLFGVKYRVENIEVLDKEGPCVIVANHQSSIDLIGMTKIWAKHVRYATVLVKQELIWVFPFGLTAWLGGLVFVDRKNHDRSKETMRRLTEKVQNKSLRVWIFPEGTRSMDETFRPFKLGAFRLAIQAQVPIVPIVFSSYKTIYNADKENKDYYWRRGCVTIKCLEPIDTKGMTLEKDLTRLTELTRQRMIEAYESIRTVTNEKKDN